MSPNIIIKNLGNDYSLALNRQEFENVCANCCFMISPEHFIDDYIRNIDLPNQILSSLLYYFTCFIVKRMKSSKKCFTTNDLTSPSNVSIFFFNVHFLLNSSLFASVKDLILWWEDSRILLKEKLEYLMILFLYSKESHFSFVPFNNLHFLKIDLREVEF